MFVLQWKSFANNRCKKNRSLNRWKSVSIVLENTTYVSYILSAGILGSFIIQVSVAILNSFLTVKLAYKLDMTNGPITFRILVSGDKNSKSHPLKKATVQLEIQTGDNVPKKVIIIPKIATPISNDHMSISKNSHI